MNVEIEPHFYEDEEFGQRLLISKEADLSELYDNLRAAKAILRCFPNTFIEINAHRMIFGIKNPEYTIDKLIGDRKGIMSERGLRSSFEKGKKQGCKVIVLDIDMHLSGYPLHTIKLAKELYFRREDFLKGRIERCYIVYREKSVCITPEFFLIEDKEIAKENIQQELKKNSRVETYTAIFTSKRPSLKLSCPPATF